MKVKDTGSRRRGKQKLEEERNTGSRRREIQVAGEKAQKYQKEWDTFKRRERGSGSRSKGKQ